MEDSPKIKWEFIFKGFLALLMTAYAIWIISSYRYHIIDNANLFFHEAGHLILWFLGDTIHFLGGSIFQLVVPLSLVVYFAIKHQTFSSAFCGIWLGESLMNTAVYVGDAKTMSIPLIGGIHDFNWLFTRWDLLDDAAEIGETMHIIASIIVIISLLFLYKSVWQAKKEHILTSSS